jgi:hypothetical protein
VFSLQTLALCSLVVVTSSGFGLVTACYKTGSPTKVCAQVDPARVQVSATEFQLVLSRGAIKAGPAIVELVNRGEDEHDLALRRVGSGAVTRRIGTVAPGGVGELSARLRPGRFVLWCTLADHRARGMRATLVVR